jgi:hypothetical protein
MKAYIVAIISRLKASVEELKYIDEDWGQLDMQKSPVKYPCCLIYINEVSWSDTGRGHQIGIAEMIFRIAAMRLSGSMSGGSAEATSEQRMSALSILELLKKIHDAIHGWSPDTDEDLAGILVGPLTRTIMRRTARRDGVQEYEMKYLVKVEGRS